MSKRVVLGRCIRCGGLAVLTPYKYYGDHTYRCLSCGAVTGSPTMYGECQLHGEIAKDKFYNVCNTCPDKKIVAGACIYFKWIRKKRDKDMT